MKKRVITLFFMLMCLFSIHYVIASACTDSDGGLNYEVKGYISDPENVDYCNNNILAEKFCKSDIQDLPDGSFCPEETSWCTLDVTCSGSCQDGACIGGIITSNITTPTENIPACTDSDNGLN